MNSRKILCSIGIGAIAGIIDVVPMMIQGLDIYSDVSAFVFWLVMGFIISNVSLPIKNWLKGMINQCSPYNRNDSDTWKSARLSYWKIC